MLHTAAPHMSCGSGVQRGTGRAAHRASVDSITHGTQSQKSVETLMSIIDLITPKQFVLPAGLYTACIVKTVSGTTKKGNAHGQVRAGKGAILSQAVCPWPWSDYHCWSACPEVSPGRRHGDDACELRFSRTTPIS